MKDRDYQVFKLSVRKATPILAMGAWPIILTLLPLIWQIVQIIFADRFERSGAISVVESTRLEASRAERRAIRAVEAAEREIPFP